VSTDAISPLRQRMIEDMSARKLNPHTTDVPLPPPNGHQQQIEPTERARGKGEDTHVFHVHLDGKEIHASVVKRMVRGMTHPTTAPYHDGSRHWTPPDSGLVGV
jgi:hypothetical protein